MNHPGSFERIDVGRAIGHDLYCRSRQPARSTWPASVREGYVAAGASGSHRPLPDRYVHKWLQLRLNAFGRGRAIDDDVTPELLRQIDVARCPVTRSAPSHGRQRDSDWSVDRLNNNGAYAANNLAVMSTGANRAKGARGYEEVYALSQREAPTDGLTPAEWLRLATLMLGPCFATQPGAAPLIPLAAPIPSRSLRPAAQQVQHVFTPAARQLSGKNALIKLFTPASSSHAAELRLRLFSEAMHQGLKGLAHAHDAWLRPGVMAAFVAWRGAGRPVLGAGRRDLAAPGRRPRRAGQPAAVVAARPGRPRWVRGFSASARLRAA